SRASPLVKEGIARTFGAIATEELVSDLLETLTNKQATVRRAAALALSGKKAHDKRSIPAFLQAWKKERDARLKYYYHQALQTITGEDIGPIVVDWENWWKGTGSEFTPPSKRKKGGDGKDQGGQAQPGGEEKKKEKGSSTVLRDVELSFLESGVGGPLFVLPAYGYEKDYLIPSLKAVEGVCRVFYIDLPTIDKFKGLQTVGGTGLVEYPVDKLCDAFDELRKQRKQHRIAILGHGLSGWVAMRYATKYPKHVSHLILVSTWSGGNAFGRGRQNLEVDGKNRGDAEQEHYAQSLLVDMQSGAPQYQPKSQAEGEALQRMGWSTFFADRRDGFASIMWPDVVREMPGCIVPDFEIAKEKGNPVPTLVVHGKRSLWTDRNDMRMLNKYYPNSSLVDCPNSAMMPMCEDYGLFVKSLKGFFRKFKFKQSVKEM
ncbi:alpha/beta fold hydrolase, partial [Planctomycetota bacterium]